ncbi:MAG: hypothetical protein JRH10_05725 [Deltaproteobacteria bacterium]|nr:hypothetical protein [Deltaproteobacteria bacterium]
MNLDERWGRLGRRMILAAALVGVTAGCQSERTHGDAPSEHAQASAPVGSPERGTTSSAQLPPVSAGGLILGGPDRRANARPPRIASVRDYRRSGDRPYWVEGENRRWRPEDVVQLLREDPGYIVDMGIWTARPVGHPKHREVGRVVNEAQALARAVGVDPGRLAFSARVEVFAKHNPTDSLCGQDCGWEGAMVDAPFDPSWIMTIPRSEQQWAIDHRWDGDARMDPWSRGGQTLWPTFLDRDGMAAANTDTHVGALYGGVRDTNPSSLARDWEFNVSAVLMDLQNPDYRAWSVKRLIANLGYLGIDPGEGAVLIFETKPGWHAYYDGKRQAQQDCFVSGSHMWIGPAGPCDRRIQPVAGPFARTPYGPGEFEAAMSAMFRELRVGLVAAGYPDVYVATVERPTFRVKWSTLAPDLRRAGWIIGELGDACHRLDVKRSGPCPLP